MHQGLRVLATLFYSEAIAHNHLTQVATLPLQFYLTLQVRQLALEIYILVLDLPSSCMLLTSICCTILMVG